MRFIQMIAGRLCGPLPYLIDGYQLVGFISGAEDVSKCYNYGRLVAEFKLGQFHLDGVFNGWRELACLRIQ